MRYLKLLPIVLLSILPANCGELPVESEGEVLRRGGGSRSGGGRRSSIGRRGGSYDRRSRTARRPRLNRQPSNRRAYGPGKKPRFSRPSAQARRKKIATDKARKLKQQKDTLPNKRKAARGMSASATRKKSTAGKRSDKQYRQRKFSRGDDKVRYNRANNVTYNNFGGGWGYTYGIGGMFMPFHPFYGHVGWGFTPFFSPVGGVFSYLALRSFDIYLNYKIMSWIFGYDRKKDYQGDYTSADYQKNDKRFPVTGDGDQLEIREGLVFKVPDTFEVDRVKDKGRDVCQIDYGATLVAQDGYQDAVSLLHFPPQRKVEPSNACQAGDLILIPTTELKTFNRQFIERAVETNKETETLVQTALGDTPLSEEVTDKELALRSPTIKLCTAQPDGSYYRAGHQMMIRASMYQLEIEIVTTNGSLDNVRQLEQRTCNAALLQEDTLPYVNKLREQATLRLLKLGSIYDEYAHLICNRSSGIKQFSDLQAGDRVLVGHPRSGSEMTWNHLSRRFPEKFSGIISETVGGAKALKQIANYQTGTVSANSAKCLFKVTSADSPLLLAIDNDKAWDKRLRLASLNIKNIVEVHDSVGDRVYQHTQIPRSAYRHLDSWFARPQTFSVKTIVVLDHEWATRHQNRAAQFEKLLTKVFND